MLQRFKVKLLISLEIAVSGQIYFCRKNALPIIEGGNGMKTRDDDCEVSKKGKFYRTKYNPLLLIQDLLNKFTISMCWISVILSLQAENELKNEVSYKGEEFSLLIDPLQLVAAQHSYNALLPCSRVVGETKLLFTNFHIFKKQYNVMITEKVCFLTC